MIIVLLSFPRFAKAIKYDLGSKPAGTLKNLHMMLSFFNRYFNTALSDKIEFIPFN